MKKYNILFKTTFGVLLIFIGLLLLGSMKVSARELDIHKMLKSKQINVNEVTYGFLYASDFDMSQEYYISEAYPLNGSEVIDNYLYFIFNENYECIGEVVLSLETGAGSFFREKCDDITRFYKNREYIYVQCFEDSVYVVTEENQLLLWGINYDKTDFSSGQNQVIELSTIVNDYSQNRSYIDETYYIDVPKRQNSIGDGNGLCWVACSLSLIDYIRLGMGNPALSYTTKGLYEYYRDNYYVPTPEYPYPVGIPSTILSLLNVFNVSINHSSSGLTFSNVATFMVAEHPILSGLWSSTGTGMHRAHLVVLCGSRRFSQTGATIYYYYRLMDPNCSSNYVVISVSNTGTNYTYNYGTTTYDTWLDTFYY